MATKRVPGGYADGRLLERALKANRVASQIIASVADHAAQSPQLAGPMIRLSVILGQQAQVLMEMETIRREGTDRQACQADGPGERNDESTAHGQAAEEPAGPCAAAGSEGRG